MSVFITPYLVSQATFRGSTLTQTAKKCQAAPNVIIMFTTGLAETFTWFKTLNTQFRQ